MIAASSNIGLSRMIETMSLASWWAKMPSMNTSQLPLIAINGCLLPGDPPKLELRRPYADAVLNAGGLPLAIPAVGGPTDLRRLLERVDGLLLGGGDDFDMARIGRGPTHPSSTLTPPEKQDWDFALAEAALEVGLPVLGICYGMQLLGLTQGAGFHQHLPEERPGELRHDQGEHSVRVEPGTKLASLMGIGTPGVDPLTVVSRHHQALANISPPWRICAQDDEGLIEAIECDGHPFAIGCQWHPELSPEGSPHAGLFRGLVAAAAMHAEQRNRDALLSGR